MLYYTILLSFAAMSLNLHSETYSTFCYYISPIFGPKFIANLNPQITIRDYILPGSHQNKYEQRRALILTKFNIES